MKCNRNLQDFSITWTFFQTSMNAKTQLPVITVPAPTPLVDLCVSAMMDSLPHSADRNALVCISRWKTAVKDQ